MPSPPKAGETQNQFLSRCIRHLISKEQKDSKQASAICYSMYRNRNKINKKAQKN